MKFFLTVMLLSSLIFILNCSDEDEGDSSYECPPPILYIENKSEYLIKQIILHSDKVYLESEPAYAYLASGESFKYEGFTGSANSYVTFIRNVTSSSDIEIAVTTPDTLLFKKCNAYRLILLEEDFFLESEVVDYLP